jgi:hypothetical protein
MSKWTSAATEHTTGSAYVSSPADGAASLLQSPALEPQPLTSVPPIPESGSSITRRRRICMHGFLYFLYFFLGFCAFDLIGRAPFISNLITVRYIKYIYVGLCVFTVIYVVVCICYVTHSICSYFLYLNEKFIFVRIFS